MHNPTTSLENKTNEFLWDSEIQIDHLISVRLPDLIIINKKKKKEFAELWTLLSKLTSE